MAKRIGKAFLVGCFVGLIGQILILILGALGVSNDMVVMAAMLAFGVIAVVMIVSGFYFKLSAFGGSGAAIPVCGLMFGAAMSFWGSSSADIREPRPLPLRLSRCSLSGLRSSEVQYVRSPSC